MLWREHAIYEFMVVLSVYISILLKKSSSTALLLNLACILICSGDR